LQRVQQEQRRPGEGRLRSTGRTLQEQVEQDAAREVQQEAGHAKAARPHPPQVRVEQERGEEDGTRLVRRIAVGERLAEPGAGMDDPVVLDA